MTSKLLMAARTVTFAAAIGAGYTASAAQNGCTASAAENLGGRYRMEGVTQAGSSYSGTAEIVMMSTNTCRIKFSDGSAGICMFEGVTISVAYLVHGKLGLSIYEICSDGSLQGRFIDDYHGEGIGKEKLTPIR
jgi:hypothetical protein